MDDSEIDFSSIEWGDELERAVRSASRADVSAARSLWGRTGGNSPRVRTSVVFRNDFARWLIERGPRYSVNLDPTGLHMRVTPNNEGGKFEVTEFKSVAILRLGFIERLPNTTFESADFSVRVVESDSPFLVVSFDKEWLNGKQLLLPPPKRETKVEDGILAGIRKVLNVLTTNDSISHGYLPTLLEMQREDVRKWVDATEQWLAGLKPPIKLNNQKYSYFLARGDAERVRKLLEG